MSNSDLFEPLATDREGEMAQAAQRCPFMVVPQNHQMKDFPAHAPDPDQHDATHPDDFVLNQLERRPCEALAAVKKLRSYARGASFDLKGPPAALHRARSAALPGLRRSKPPR